MIVIKVGLSWRTILKNWKLFNPSLSTKKKLAEAFRYTLLVVWMALMITDLMNNKAISVLIDTVFVFISVFDIVQNKESENE